MKVLLYISAILTALVVSSQAGIGWGFDECVRHYGNETPEHYTNHFYWDLNNGSYHNFHVGKMLIYVYFSNANSTACAIGYWKDGAKAFTDEEINTLLRENVPDGVTWEQKTPDPCAVCVNSKAWIVRNDLQDGSDKAPLFEANYWGEIRKGSFEGYILLINGYAVE